MHTVQDPKKGEKKRLFFRRARKTEPREKSFLRGFGSGAVVSTKPTQPRWLDSVVCTILRFAAGIPPTFLSTFHLDVVG